MLTVRKYEQGRVQQGGLELLPAKLPAPDDKGATLWIDVEAPDTDTLNTLASRFNLHPLAIEDCMNLGQRPKLEEYPGHQFIVLQGFYCLSDDWREVKLHELHFFLGQSWLITVHEAAHKAVTRLGDRVTSDPQSTIGLGPDVLVYLLADYQVDSNFPVLDEVTGALDALEDAIFDKPDRAVLQEAFELKRTLVHLRKVLAPQRDVVGLLSRGGVAQISQRTTVYFRDVYDHLIRLHEQIDTARDLLGNAMDAYLSLVANRTGDITKQLTVFASIFMPLSFVAGFFGQNFEVLSAKPFFYVMSALMLAIPIGMGIWFWHKRWWG